MKAFNVNMEVQSMAKGNIKLLVDLTNIMVVHIMNNKIGYFDKFVLRE